MPKTPLRTSKEKLSQLDAFAKEAERKPEQKQYRKLKTRADLPWNDERVRKDMTKGLGIVLSEPHLLKLQFIARHTDWSQRRFCREKLQDAIDREVEKLLRKGITD